MPKYFKSGIERFDMQNEPLAPLNGLKVIEFCSVAAGPFCSMLLADMGADVVKIEPPSGDSLRQWPPLSDGFSENFASLNRNKKSIALDLKTPEGCATADALIRRADVLIENNRPGVMARLGLGPEHYSKCHPGLIYCSLSAFGQTGPRSQDGGFDVTMQAFSGIMSVTGEPDGGPVKCGVPISDFSTGLYAAFAIAALLLRSRATGKGGHIDVSMLGSSLAVAALQTSEFFGSGINPLKLGAAHPRNAPYEAFKASDCHFVVAAGNDKLWQSVCDMIGQPGLAADPRFDSTRQRATNQAALREILAPIFAARDARFWLDQLNARGVPCSPINTYSEILSDPQVASQEWIQPLVLPGGHETRTFGSPIRIDGRGLSIRRPPPALDGDRDRILADLASARGAPLSPLSTED